jgi:hypothetical protein
MALDALVDAGMKVDVDVNVDVDVDVGPTVAASANRLELTLQQLFLPQHQLLTPHFCTPALSTCHYVHMRRQMSVSLLQSKLLTKG